MTERRGKAVTGWLLGVLLIAALSHVAVVYAYPRLIMRGAWEAMAEAADPNGLIHAPLPDATSRTVVRPSPDLLYSVCIFDLAAGPWAIGLAVPETYMSVSLYAMNTDNFFTVNDRQIDRESLRLLIVPGAVDEVPAADGTLVVRSPSERGIALVRFFAGRGDQADNIEAARRTLRCGAAAHTAEMSPSPRARRLGGD